MLDRDTLITCTMPVVKISLAWQIAIHGMSIEFELP